MDDKNKNKPPPPAPESDEPEDPTFKKLGSCCICGKYEKVRTVILINRKCVIRGHGWGCLVCHLPKDGAVSVLCEKCMQLFEAGLAQIRLACEGYPWESGRVPIEQLTEIHEHNHRIHVLYETSFKAVN